MATESEEADILSRIHHLSKSHRSIDSPLKSQLNIPLREHLHSLAFKNGHHFSQDNAGNIAITRAGTDSELSSFALAFPLDSLLEPDLAAIETFLKLQQVRTACDITLLGWSSLNHRLIGRDIFENFGSQDKDHDELKEIFSKTESSSIPSLSAIFEIRKTTNQSSITASGSAVLLEAVKAVDKNGQWGVRIEDEGPPYRRVPSLRVKGDDAVEFSALVVENYSSYVSMLFDNFD